MKKVVVFGASNSSKSINQQFVKWAASLLANSEIHVLNLNDYEMPIYSMDRELADGIPDEADQFKNDLNQADGVMISFAEHNGSYTTAFKNIFDWISRLEKPVWPGKPMFLMATSPGARGAKGALSGATGSFPHLGGQIVASFSLPSFNQNFNPDVGITNAELKVEFQNQLGAFENSLIE